MKYSIRANDRATVRILERNEAEREGGGEREGGMSPR